MMRKKQYLAALLAVMLFALSACGELTPGSSEENAPQQQMTVGESNREEAQQPTDNSRTGIRQSSPLNICPRWTILR